MSTNGLEVMYAGDTLPQYTPQLLDENNEPIPLTGLSGGTSGVSPCNFTLKLQLVDEPGTVIEGGGTFGVVNAAQGIISYAWLATDTTQFAATGQGQAVVCNRYIIINWSAGNNQHLLPDELTIRPAP